MTFALVIPGPLDRRSGGYSYDVDLVSHLREEGHEVAIWSLPQRRAMSALKSRLSDHPEVVIFDALVHHILHERWAHLVRFKRGLWVGLVHQLSWRYEPALWRQERSRRLERAFLGHMDAFVFNSEDTRQDVEALLGSGPYRPSTVCRPPLGVPPVGFMRPSNRGRLLFLANVLPHKNLHGLLEALALVRDRRPDLNWTLSITGTERDSRYVRRCRAAARGMPVRWLGWISEEERVRIWEETDLLALPSVREGWGMAHAEALAHGIPSLAVPIGASREVLGDAALWSEPDASSLADAVERYLSDETLRTDLGLRARHRAPALRSTVGFRTLPAFWNDLARWRKHGSAGPRFVSYLEAKRTVDSRALHPRVWEAAFAGTPRSVVELGGGSGTMIRRLMERKHIDASTPYTLVDIDAESLSEASRLATLFDPGRLSVRCSDLLSYWEEQLPSPDLVIAHTVLDLFDARSAASALARMRAKRYWLTHLFDGFTAWEPVVDASLDAALVSAYHRTMESRAPGGAGGTPRAGRDWLAALPQAGLRIVDAAASDWIVRPVDGTYPADESTFLRSILHFFRESLTGIPEVDQDGLAWWLAVRQRQVERAEATFIAHQYDVVAELARTSHQQDFRFGEIAAVPDERSG